MTITEVAKLKGVTRQTICLWCRRGLLGHRVGGRWRVTEDDLRRFDLRCAVPDASEKRPSR